MLFFRFGTFLFDCERERRDNSVREKTHSLWSFINSNTTKYKNVLYQPVDAVIYPSLSLKRLKVWENYHFRNLAEYQSFKSAEDCAKTLLVEYQQTIKQLEQALAKT